jgi:hypothetical protein
MGAAAVVKKNTSQEVCLIAYNELTRKKNPKVTSSQSDLSV